MRGSCVKDFKSSMFLFLIVYFSLIFLHCTKYKELTPFFDGLFLEYEYGSRLKLIYNVNVLESNKFKILKKDTFYKTYRGKTEILVDAYGRVYESSSKRYKGKFSPIWIPVHEMEIGDTFDGRNIVERKAKWEKWDVLVVKDIPTGAEDYYELNTGYLVGSYAKTDRGIGKSVLVKTNANIPVVEE